MRNVKFVGLKNLSVHFSAMRSPFFSFFASQFYFTTFKCTKQFVSPRFLYPCLGWKIFISIYDSHGHQITNLCSLSFVSFFFTFVVVVVVPEFHTIFLHFILPESIRTCDRMNVVDLIRNVIISYIFFSSFICSCEALHTIIIVMCLHIRYPLTELN